MKRRLFRGLALLALAGVVSFAVLWVLFPYPGAKLDGYPSSTELLDRDGQCLRVALDENDTFCLPVPLADMGPWLGPAVVAVEDKRFFRHGGVDLLALGRALGQNLAARRVVSGASTISTQVVRLIDPRPRNLPAKVIEAFRALQLERRLPKEQILEQYLNRAPFGSNLIGVEAASRRYFGKPAADLSLAEAALLAGLPQNPSRLRPDRYPQRAARRRNHVLGRMLACGFITRPQMEAAAGEAVVCRTTAPVFRAPHFCDLVQARYPQARTLHTTLDGRLQIAAEDVLRRRIAGLSEQGVHGGAVVIVEVRTGAVRALVGSPDFWSSRWPGQVNAALARRSPGSTLKPLVYALAMDQGLCTPATALADVPQVWAGYRPQNFDREFSGPVAVREALVRSLNIPALTITRGVGLDNVLRLLRQTGLTTLDKPARYYGLGIALGGGEVTLLDLANAYAGLARGGRYQPLRLLVDEPAIPPVRLFSEEAAYLVTDILSGDERAADLCGHLADTQSPRVAWKTGTSAGQRDAWTVAYNPEYVVGVWLGNPNGQKSPALVGSAVAAPVAYEILRDLYPHGQAPWFVRPGGLRTRLVCARSGLIPTDRCPSTVTDFYIPGVSATRECAVHQRAADHQVVEVWPTAVASCLETHGIRPAQASTREPIRINSPVWGDTISRLPDRPGVNQEIPLVVAGDVVSDRIYWFVDGNLFVACQPGRRVFWPVRTGRHTITCSDNLGRTDTVQLSVE